MSPQSTPPESSFGAVQKEKTQFTELPGATSHEKLDFKLNVVSLQVAVHENGTNSPWATNHCIGSRIRLPPLAAAHFGHINIQIMVLVSPRARSG